MANPPRSTFPRGSGGGAPRAGAPYQGGPGDLYDAGADAEGTRQAPDGCRGIGEYHDCTSWGCLSAAETGSDK